MDRVQLIVLNGASSAGKTVLCRRLQEILDEPTIHLEEDRFVFGTYHERFLDGDLGPEIFRRTMLGYYRSLKAFLSAGHHVLADSGFYTPQLVEAFVRELGNERVWLVGVHCALDELERRERTRGDRQPGLAREQHESIHAAMAYDIEVDTSAESLEACAERIKVLVTGHRAPTAMALLRERADATDM